MSYQQPPAPQLNDTLFTKIDDFEARIRVLERQGFDATVGGPAGTAGGDLSGTYPNPKVVRAAGNFNAGDNITSNSGEAGQVRLGARGSGGEIAVGAPTDSYVYRKAAGVIGVDNYIDANLGLRIGGNALASTHLSDSADILRGSGLAAGPTGPSVTVSPLGFNPGGSGQTALLLRSGSDTGATGNAQIAFGYDETNTMMHRIGTRHNPAAQANNAIDFYVWQRAVDSTTALGTQPVMTLDSTGSNVTSKLTIQPTGAPSTINMLDIAPGGGVADNAYMTVMGRARFGYSATGSININDAGLSKTFRLELGAANNLVMSMNATGQMALPGQGSTGGLLIGGDTNLYWNASNQLRTDDLLITVGLRSTANASYGFRSEQAAGNVAYGNVLLSTDANYAFQITGQGTHQWGAGGASPVDTVLYRAAADVLGTDDEFLINRPVIAGHYAPILTWGARRFWRNSSGSSAESSFAQWSVANTRWEAANTSTIIGPGVIETSYANPTWKFRTAGIASFTQGDPLTFVDALVIASTGAVGFGLTPTAGRLQLLADTTAAGGIYFGGDTNLYRGAANVLQTSGNFSMGSAATRDALLTNQGWDIRYRTAAQATSVLYGVRIDSEPNYRFYFDANGKHQWGDGTATPDTTLYRSAADQLQTDDKFVVNHPAGYGIIVLTPRRSCEW